MGWNISGYHFIPLFWILIFSSAVTLAIGMYLKRQRPLAAMTYLVWLEFAIAEWIFAGAFEVAATSVESKLFWSQIAYLGTTLSPVLYLLFVSEYLFPATWSRHWTKTLLFLPALVILILAWTNSWHGCLWSHILLDPGRQIAVYLHGPCFWGFIFYAYVLLLTGFLLLLFSYFRFPSYYRPQILLLITGSLFPFVANLIYVFDINPIPGLDWTLLAFLLTGFFLAFSVRSYRLGHLVPLATRTLMQKIPDPVLLIDHEGKIVTANPVFYAHFSPKGFPSAGMLVTEVFDEWEDLPRFMATTESLRQEVKLTCAGTPRFYDLSVSLLCDWQETINGRLFVFRDISRRKQSEMERERTYQDLQNAYAQITDQKSELEHLVEELKLSNAAKDRFFSIIAHDLINPFVTINGFIRLMQEHMQDFSRQEIQDLIDDLKKNVHRTQSLLENLLEWARAQTSRIAFSPKPLYLNSLLDEQLLTVQDSMQQKGITHHLDLCRNDQVHADGNMMAVVIRNLFTNAIKYTRPGGSITVRTERTESAFSLFVQDTGIGMRPEMIEKLFRIDNRVHTEGTRGEKGSGLGLILCKEFIDQHAGEIRIKSTPDSGSIFQVILPLN